MADLFPRTTVGGVSLSRMIMGTNWLFGYSHTGPAADAGIREKYQKPEDFFPVFKAYLDRGVDTLMGPISLNPVWWDAIRYAEDKLGKKITVVETINVDVSDTPEARREAQKIFRNCRKNGAVIGQLAHNNVEHLVNRHLHAIPRLSDYLSMLREEGLIPGVASHMPEVVQYCDNNEYDVETYIQIFNCMGFLMQVEVESVAKVIHRAQKPVMTIKPMAAGRCTPYVGLTFSWNAIRDFDMVTVGAGSAAEAEEDIEISLAAIEHRFPYLGSRSSPVKSAVLGH